MDDKKLRRVALVIHPTRPVDTALGKLNRWATQHGVDLVQLATDGTLRREVAAPGILEAGDLVVALGGDGTVLSAVRAASVTNAPVLGVACGSLGALTEVSADELEGALARAHRGDWTARSIPALVITSDAADDWAFNDVVVVRRGSGQIVADVAVDGELYVRLAGDGVVVATPAGSSGYSMAAGGPLLAAHLSAYVCTPLAMHGGNAPPLVVRADATLTLDVHQSHAGFDVEVDGHRRPLEGRSFRLSLHENRANLVTFSPPGQGLDRLRRRGLIADSPRILARDTRAARYP
jgi:NAD+ kinase